MCPMWDNDIIYGGEQLEPNVELGAQYVLWDCAIVAENIHTSLGDDATKVEVVISRVRDNVDRMLSDPPAKYGTFASAIVSKVRQKADGDLPAVITFSKVPSSQAANQDAFVMTFVARWDGDPATPVPAIVPVAPTAPPPKLVDAETGRYYTEFGGRRVLGDAAPKAAVKAARDAAKDAQAAKDKADADIPF